MIPGFSKGCLGVLCSRSTLRVVLPKSSRDSACNLGNFTVRHYSATVLKQKQKQRKAGTSAGVSKNSETSYVPQPTVTTVSSKTPRAGSSSLKEQTRSAPVSKNQRHSQTGGGMSYKIPEEKVGSMTEEEQIEQVEQIIAMSKYFPTADPWGQRVETLDVSIPYSIKPAARKQYPSWGAMFDQFLQNRYNSAKNATSLLLLAQSDAIPGFDLSEATLVQKFITQWPWRIFTATSVKPNSWMEPLRKMALMSYQQLNMALAQQDDKRIKELSTSTYQDNIMRLKRNQNSNFRYIWRFHREVTPTRIISIRGTEGYLAAEDPKFGNRMMIHALVRIDSEQSLEIYDKRGLPLHPQPSNMSSDSGPSSHPAERRRVTEYLVFEKRMWYDGPWVIREQLWETPGKEAVV